MASARIKTVKSMFTLPHDMLSGTGLEGIGLPYRQLSGEQHPLAVVNHHAISDRWFAIPDNRECSDAYA